MPLSKDIAQLRGKLNVQSDDTKFHDEMLYQELKDVRNELIRQETDKGRLGNRGQLLEDFQFSAVDISRLERLRTGERILESVKTLPRVLDNASFGRMINLVSTRTGIIFYPTTLSDYLVSKKRRYTSGVPKYLFRGDRMYIVGYDQMAETLFADVDAFFEDPEALQLAQPANECKSILDIEFEMPGFLRNRIFEIARNQLAQRYNLPNDTINNDQEDLTPNTR